MELFAPQNTLTRNEALRLDELETTIDAGLKTFVDVGLALMEIRDGRLYRESYGTFEDYCRERWGMVRRHANRLIAAAGVIENLGPIGPILPETESQARPLAQLPDEMQAEAWRLAVDTAPNGKITAAHVQSVVDGFSEDDDELDIWEDGCHNCKFLQTHGETWWCTELSRQTYVEFIACNMELWKPEEPEPETPKTTIDNPVLYSSDSEEWYTPPHIIERAVKLMGAIDLDPCSNQGAPRVPASQHYTIEHDGLSRQWSGRVYMNPPYGREIVKWIEYLCQQYEGGNVAEAVALVPSRTDTAWFLRTRDYLKCFITGRLSFSDNETGAPFPSVAVYLGKNEQKFIDVFSDIGDVYERCTRLQG